MNCYDCGECMRYARESLMVVRRERVRRMEDVGKWICFGCGKKVLGYEKELSPNVLSRWKKETRGINRDYEENKFTYR